MDFILDFSLTTWPTFPFVFQVGVSNVDCLKYGFAYCKLNFEAQQSYQIQVQVTDTGSPPLSRLFTLTVKLRDINDKPRNFTIDNDRVSS